MPLYRYRYLTSPRVRSALYSSRAVVLHASRTPRRGFTPLPRCQGSFGFSGGCHIPLRPVSMSPNPVTQVLSGLQAHRYRFTRLGRRTYKSSAQRSVASPIKGTTLQHTKAGWRPALQDRTEGVGGPLAVVAGEPLSGPVSAPFGAANSLCLLDLANWARAPWPLHKEPLCMRRTLSCPHHCANAHAPRARENTRGQAPLACLSPNALPP